MGVVCPGPDPAGSLKMARVRPLREHAPAQHVGLQPPGRGPGQKQALRGVCFEDLGVCFVNSAEGHGGDGLGAMATPPCWPNGARSLPVVSAISAHGACARSPHTELPLRHFYCQRSVPGTSGLEAVPSTVALGQAVELLQQLLEVVPLHSRIQEAGPAPQVQCAQLLGQVPKRPVPGGR